LVGRGSGGAEGPDPSRSGPGFDGDSHAPGEGRAFSRSASGAARRETGAASPSSCPLGSLLACSAPSIFSDVWSCGLLTVAEIRDWYLEEARAARILGRNRRPIKKSTLDGDESRIESKPLLGSRNVRNLVDIENAGGHCPGQDCQDEASKRP